MSTTFCNRFGAYRRRADRARRHGCPLRHWEPALARLCAAPAG